LVLSLVAPMPRLAVPGYCRLVLGPDPPSAAALDLMLSAHARLLGWLDISVPAEHSADLVALHRNFYDAARTMSGLPARSVTLAFKDWVRRRRGEIIDGLPLDEKLYAIKGIESVSIATLSGRVTVPFHVDDYAAGWADPAPARLVKRQHDFELRVSTDEATNAKTLRTQEDVMSVTESALKRIGRVIAGMTNLAIDAAEGVNPEAVITQAIREIDAAADEVRGDLGKATAERYRLDVRRQQLLHEKAELDQRVALALDEGRDDLAEAGIARQIDIEAQVGVLDRLLGETDEQIAQLGQTIDAIAASRREAEQTRKEFRESQSAQSPAGQAPAGKTSGAMTKVARAQAATARVTGVPPSPATASAKALSELADLAREREVKLRLARLRSGRAS
jgi:phage shock protein A